MLRRLQLLVAGLILLLQVTGFSQKNPTRIILLHTNDMHSKIDPMARLAYLADSLRRGHPYVFLVSAGDNMTGNPVVDMVPDKGAPMIDLMNRCGFNVSAVGNHEFDMGQKLMKARLLQAKFPFVCANMDGSEAEVGQVRPYTILKAGDEVSIAFLGLLQLDDNGLPSAHPANMTGVKFVNGLTKAKEFAFLKKENTLLIALSHLGIDDDIRLADSLPAIDLIIGGHSHTVLMQPRFAGQTMIVQTGAYMKYVGKTTLTLHEGKVIERNCELIPFSSLKQEDRGVRSIIDMVNQNPEFNRIAGTAETVIEGEEELGCLMTDAIRAGIQAEIAFQNRGGIRVPSLGPGAITLKKVYELDPFNNQVVLYSMTPEEIRSLICYGYEHEKRIDLRVSGMTYHVTADSSSRCLEVEMLGPSGAPLDPAREYLVAINSYMAATYKFSHRDPGTSATLTTCEALVRYLNNHSPLNYSGVSRTSSVIR